MLQILSSSKNLRIGKLMNLYHEPSLECGFVQLETEQNFYGFVLDFLRQADSFYAVWEIQGKYVCALRMEQYQDGLLLAGLVTDSQLRNKGYAKALISAVLKYVASNGCRRVFSHIRKDNLASICAHTACGFERIKESAVFIDGSVDHQSCTLVYKV